MNTKEGREKLSQAIEEYDKSQTIKLIDELKVPNRVSPVGSQNSRNDSNVENELYESDNYDDEDDF